MPNSNDRYVVVAQGGGWNVVKTDYTHVSGTFATRPPAITRAKEIVANLGGGTVWWQDANGDWEGSVTVESSN